MAGLNKAKIDDFFDELEKKIVRTQKKIVATGLDRLFAKSPHAGESRGKQSKSEYDANHKISVNGKGHSAHHGPTGNKGVSQALVNTEKLKMGSVKIGDRVTILNDTEHALDVEVGKLAGGNRWKRSGYYPFRGTLNELKEKYNNVLK